VINWGVEGANANAVLMEGATRPSKSKPLVAFRGDYVSTKAATARPLHRSPLAQTGRFLGFTISHDSGMSLDLVISNIAWPNFSCGNSR
jgi:hypothetical protein